MSKKRLLREMAEAAYPDEPDLVTMILADADAHGTAGRIESGELTLPHIDDARRHLARLKSEAGGE